MKNLKKTAFLLIFGMIFLLPIINVVNPNIVNYSVGNPKTSARTQVGYDFLIDGNWSAFASTYDW